MNQRMMRDAQAKMTAAEEIRQRLAAAPPELSAPIEEEFELAFSDAQLAVKTAATADPDPDEEEA
jgi:hypothetical protein